MSTVHRHYPKLGSVRPTPQTLLIAVLHLHEFPRRRSRGHRGRPSGEGQDRGGRFPPEGQGSFKGRVPQGRGSSGEGEGRQGSRGRLFRPSVSTSRGPQGPPRGSKPRAQGDPSPIPHGADEGCGGPPDRRGRGATVKKPTSTVPGSQTRQNVYTTALLSAALVADLLFKPFRKLKVEGVCFALLPLLPSLPSPSCLTPLISFPRPPPLTLPSSLPPSPLPSHPSSLFPFAP